MWFQKAMTGGTDYDAEFIPLAKQDKSAPDIFWALAIKDIQSACDAFRPLSSLFNCQTANAPPAVASGAVVAVFVSLIPLLPREGSGAPGGARGGGEPPWIRSCVSLR